MFTKSARFYDAIYSFKDHRGEAERLHALIEAHKRSAGCRLLDVGCGTGAHLAFLAERYEVEGVDLDLPPLAVAGERLPGVPFHEGDMVAFDLGRRFDVVTCFFSAVAYVKTAPRLRQAVGAMARHLAPGGILIVEPWITPDKVRLNHIGETFLNEPDLKIARMNTTTVEAGVSTLHFHYLVGTPRGHRVLYRAA